MMEYRIRKILGKLRKAYRMRKMGRSIEQIIKSRELSGLNKFDFSVFYSKVSLFLESMQTDDSSIHFRYSANCQNATLYASAYACMTYCLLGKLEGNSASQKRKWADYFDSFQNSENGMFYDPVVVNDIYEESDWWGARHLALHMISAYAALGIRPKYEFGFLKQYYDVHKIQTWLDGFDWSGESIGLTDVDNKIMNIGCLLQYQRDTWADASAGAAVEFLKNYLRSKINPQTGMWMKVDTVNLDQRSRMVQFAYHLLLIYFYDNDFNFDHEKIIHHVLNTQNKYGGYGVQYNSSACEDIDSIDILVRLYPYVSDSLKKKISQSISLATPWVLANQVVDNGFVFRLNSALKYGHQEMNALANIGAMFPTWFRTLSIAYITSLQDPKRFNVIKAPGYVFPCHTVSDTI